MGAAIYMVAGGVGLALAGAVGAGVWMRSRAMNRWLGSYIRSAGKRRAPRQGEVHVLLCIADHFEPQVGKVDAARAAGRVASWVREYPRVLGAFRDSDGRPPRHSFFFPIDEYDAGHVEAIAGLCRVGFGEIEIHLHHDHDTAEGLRRRLGEFVRVFRDVHGVLARHRETGETMYGFIHGNWALDNSRPDGRWCGVNNELDVLRETGCYADFTLPSAPSQAQTRKINSIYYAVDDPARAKSHDWGVDVGTGARPERGLMLIQGPLVLNWGSRKFGVLPRVENGCIQKNQPPTMGRLENWLRARVQVGSRPDWYFVKLHTHGAAEGNQAALLGAEAEAFHRGLAERATRDRNFHFHYVTAREMYNLVRAAEAGWTGSVEEARDFELEIGAAASGEPESTRPRQRLQR